MRIEQKKIDDFKDPVLRLTADWTSHYKLISTIKEQFRVTDEIAENVIRWLVEKKHLIPITGHLLRYRRKPRIRIYESYFRIVTGYVVRGITTLSYVPAKAIYRDLRRLREEIRESLGISAVGANIVLEHLLESKQLVEIEHGIYEAKRPVVLPPRVPTGVEIRIRVPEEILVPIIPPVVPPERIRFIYTFTFLATKAQTTGETRHIEIHVEGAVTRDKLEKIGMYKDTGLIPEGAGEFVGRVVYSFIYEEKSLEAEPHAWEDRTEEKPVTDDELKILDIHIYDFTYGEVIKASSKIVNEKWSDWTPEKLAEEWIKAPEFYSMIGAVKRGRPPKIPPAPTGEEKHKATAERIERMRKKLEEFR